MNLKNSLILFFIFVFHTISFAENTQNNDNEVTITTSTNNIHAKVAVTFSVPQNAEYKVIRWFFGDGTDAFGTNVEKTYQSAGNYTVKAVIITSDCSSLTLQTQIVVNDGITSTIANMIAGSGKVWVMAHRANTGDKTIPENSISAINACIEAGIDAVEIDTHLTKDGQVVVCHDATINRTTNGTGNIADYTLAEIKQFRLKDRNGTVTNETMPTLEEMLLAGKNKIFFDLDYSPRTASTKQVCDVVQKCEMTDEVLFYTGSNTDYVTELFSYSGAVHPLIWASMTASYTPLINKGRKFFVQLDHSSRNAAFLSSVIANGLLLQYNFLNAADADFAAGDNTIVNELLTGTYPASVIMTDNAVRLVNYLESLGRR